MTNSLRNKKNGLRRVVFLWLFLIFVEGGFSGLCDEYQDTANKTANSFAYLLETTPETASAGSSHSPDSHPSGCTDECFCRIQMLPTAFSSTRTALAIENKPFTFILLESPTQTLTPPFLPPKSV